MSIARGPKAIARHLNSERFMGRYARTLRAIFEYNAERERDEADLDFLGRQLSSAFTHGATVTASAYSCTIEARGHSRGYAAKVYQGQVALEIDHMPMSVATAVTVAYESALTAAHGGEQPAEDLGPVASSTPAAAPEIGPEEVPSVTRAREPIEELTRQLADHLGGGWTTRTEPNPYYDGTRHTYLVHRDGRKIGIQSQHRGWVSNGHALPAERIRAWGIFPPTERRFGRDERPETTAAISRGAKAIARQLSGDRFMGNYARALQAVVHYNADQTARTMAMQAEGQRLADLLVHGASVKATAHDCEVRRWRQHRKYAANIICHGVHLELGYMPPSVAIAVTAAYEAALTGHLVQQEAGGPAQDRTARRRR
ncbi:hypothetical protein ACIBBE_24265 [Streptomyces sp. NPDC051644]|uniref:hypothetical protein n=1 Tax=Streptomyces sp. NPDC051644 TaxID=3365666 RepID=UPI00379937A1